MGLIFAFIAVLGWGTWIGVGQGVRFSHPAVRTVWVGLFSSILASLVILASGGSLVPDGRWLEAFAGGLVWALSAMMAFYGTNNLGIARANGIWTPLNILTSLICGMVIFGEFRNASGQTWLFLTFCVVLFLIGILVLIFAKPEKHLGHEKRNPMIGTLSSLATGFLWGIYIYPVNSSGLPTIVAQLPLSLGIFVGGLLLVLILKRPRLFLNSSRDYVLAGLSGALWCAGNYGMLLLTGVVGSGLGFAIAQSALVVNALWGILLLRDPPIRSKAAVISLAGILLVALGAVLLSLVRS